MFLQNHPTFFSVISSLPLFFVVVWGQERQVTFRFVFENT